MKAIETFSLDRPAATTAARFNVKIRQSVSSAVRQRVERLPVMVWLDGNIGPGWRTVRPILVTLEQDDDGEYIASDAFSTVYGNGESSEHAVHDYCSSLMDYYELLASRARENGQAAVLLYRLSQHVRKSPS